MNKTKKRFSLLVTLLCAFVLVLSLGIVSACGNNESASTDNDGVNTQVPAGGTWYYGEDIPASDLGQDGDFYLNTKTLSSYVKEGKAWRTAAYDEVGTWYYGTEKLTSDDTFGEVNDFYLDTASGTLYQKKAEGWTLVLTLKGDKGRDGVLWFSGKTNPDELPDGDTRLKDAIKGDFYLNYTDFTVWQLKEDGTWFNLGTIRGEDAKDAVQVFDGDGAPDTEENKVKLADAKPGDLYIGQFDGSDDIGSGSRLYRYNGETWEVLMESIHKNQLDIHNYAELVKFRENVASGKSYAGKEVHLKDNIDFNEVETASLHRAAARAVTDWTPIGTSDHPFMGTFDGEGHTISNFTVTSTSDAQAAGFFGNVEDATVQNLCFVGVKVEATGEGAVAAVVVGQAKGDVSFNNVTVDAECNAQKNATVGGLVGSLAESGSEKKTELKVEGSSFTGTGAEDLVGDKGDVTVTVTDSTLTDSASNTTVGWDNGGNHYAEDEDESRSYFVSSADDISKFLSAAQTEDGKVSVTLESDLDLSESALTVGKGVDLTLDVGGKNLTVKSQSSNAGIQVGAGSNLTIKGSESGNVHLDSASNKPAISVSGSGASLNIEGANVNVKNTNSGKSPAIVAEKGASVNIGGGSHISVEGQGRDSAYKEPQLATATGKDSTITVDDENTVIELDNAIGLYASKDGTINFKNGTLNMTGGSCCVGLGLGEGAGKIVFSGGIINITGDLIGKHVQGEGLENVAVAIGSTQEACAGAEVIVNGGIINLAPTSGIAIAFGGAGVDDMSVLHAGDEATVNLNATQDGKAYVASSTQGSPSLVIYVYDDINLTGVDDTRNFRRPELMEYIAGGYGRFCGGSVSFYDGSDFWSKESMPSEYTKAGMGLVQP